MPQNVSSIWNTLIASLQLRRKLPPDLRNEFIALQDIKSIDRIQIAAWIGFILTTSPLTINYPKTSDHEINSCLLSYHHLSPFHQLLVRSTGQFPNG